MLPKGLLKEHSKAISMMIRGMDMTVVFFAGWLAYVIRFNEFDLPLFYWGALLIGALLTPAVFSFFKMYHSVRGKSFFNYFFDLVNGMIILAFVLAGCAFFTKSGIIFSRTWFGIWIFIAFIFLLVVRGGVLLLLRFMRAQGLNERRVLVIGAGELGVRFSATIQQAMWTGFRIVAFMDDAAETKPAFIQQIPVLQMAACLNQYLSEHAIDEVWIALPLHAEARVKEILHELRYETIATRFVLDIFGLDLLNHSISDIAGFPVLNMRSTPIVGMNRLVKNIEDRVLSAFILILISPLMVLITIAVKLSSPGPIFYRQKRVGWNGQEFEMLKFRTMPVNAESATGPVWATAADSRPTWVGKFLRRTSLDELPQFINVLKGEMSIVGPRPERRIFVEEFKEKIPRYMQKHFVNPGITGWAQVNGWRGNTSLEKRIEYDLFYIENWSVSFDLKIILLTVIKGFNSSNAY